MKTAKLLPIMTVALLLTDLPTQASTLGLYRVEIRLAHPTDTSAVTTIGRKRKGYRPKRGGLFNTGLFRKKNACGCPNH